MLTTSPAPQGASIDYEAARMIDHTDLRRLDFPALIREEHRLRRDFLADRRHTCAIAARLAAVEHLLRGGGAR
jgi:hypothetical protein